MKPEAMMKLSILAIAAPCWIRPQLAVAQPQEADVRVLEHVSCGTEAPQAQMLNAYLVQRETPTAAVVQIASGGWNSSSPQGVNLEPFKPSLDDFLKRYDADRPALASLQTSASIPTAREQRVATASESGDRRRPNRQQDNSSVSVGEASRYSLGAKFEPPVGRVVHGIGQWEQYNAKLLGQLPPDLHPVSELLFVTIGDTPRGWRPQGIIATLQRYDQAGLIPSIDIAPRGNQPAKAVLDRMPDPLFGIDHEVASGSRFDSRIEDLARIARDFRKPVIVRIGGEFNGSWNGYHPYAYPKAFRKIVEMFRAAKVDNAAFVWCYEPAAPGDFDERNEAGEYKWFPGDGGSLHDVGKPIGVRDRRPTSQNEGKRHAGVFACAS